MKPTDNAAADLAGEVARQIARLLPSTVPLEVSSGSSGPSMTRKGTRVFCSTPTQRARFARRSGM